MTWVTTHLTQKGDAHPKRSAEWLLSHATGLSRIELYAHHDRPLSERERADLRKSVRRRAEGEPLQYVCGEVAFRHIVVKVGPGVLIPRPETEVVVQALLDAIASVAAPVIVDLCTGSGCIAASVAKERPDATVYAVDISSVACEVASDNITRLGLADRVTILEGDLLGPLPAELLGTVHGIIANPPYVPTADLAGLDREVVGYEPAVALDGGVDGLAVAARLWDDARSVLAPGGVICVELDERRVEDGAQAIRAWYEDVRIVRDLAQRPRAVVARLPLEGEGRTAASNTGGDRP